MSFFKKVLQKIQILPENSWKIAKKKLNKMCNLYLTRKFTLWTFDMGIFVVLFEGDVYVQDFGRPGTDQLQKDHLFGKTFPTKMALGRPKKKCWLTFFLSIAHKSQPGRWTVVERAHDWWMKSSLAQSSRWCPTRSDLVPCRACWEDKTQLETDWSLTFPYCWWKKSCKPVDMVNIPLFTGFHTSQVVQDFFHQQ